ncbi:VMAP-C domain-containing protein [Streptomyces sp. NPDC002004]
MTTRAAPLPHEVRRRLLGIFVNELSRLDCVRDPAQRIELTELVGEYLGRKLEIRGGDARGDMVFLVRSVLHEQEGVDALFFAVGTLSPDELRELRERVRLEQQTADGPLAGPFPAQDAAAARSLLERAVGIPPRRLRDGLAHELGRDLPRALPPAALFDELLEANAQADGLPPAVVLVEYAAALAEKGGALLRAWSDRWAEGAGADETAALERRRERIRTAAGPDGSIPRCVVVMVDPAHDGSPDVDVRHWINPAPGYWDPVAGPVAQATTTTLAGAVERAIREAEGEWADGPEDDEGPVHVEFVLPYSMLNHDVARLELGAQSPDPVAIGPRYFVHLRSLERMRANNPIQLNSWRTRWKKLRHKGLAQVHPWDPEHDARLDVWRTTLAADKALTAVTLGSPAREDRGLEPLKAAIAEGVGLAMWDRRDVSEARELLRVLIGYPSAQIPATIHRLRALAEGDAQPEHMLGRHVALFWDDPYRRVDCEEVPA